MPPQPRQRTKLGKNHPAKPAESDQEQEAPSPGSSDASRGRAGTGRTGAQVPGAPDPGTGNREPGSGRAEPETQVPEHGRAGSGSGDAGDRVAGTGRQVAWTDEAKKVRSELTAWAAARRKAVLRAGQAREAAGQVPAGELAVIVEKVAEATGETLDEVRQAVGLTTEP